MQLKQWRTLGIILAVLLGVYFLTQIREAGKSVKSSSLIDLAEDEVGRIVIIEGGQRAELVRLDTLWVMAGHETRQLINWRMNAIFASVLGARRESLISENPAKWGTYGVGSNGRQIMVYDLKGDLRGHWFVGQSSSNFRAGFVRAADQDVVYMTDRNIHPFLGTGLDFWLEPPPAPNTTGARE